MPIRTTPVSSWPIPVPANLSLTEWTEMNLSAAPPLSTRQVQGLRSALTPKGRAAVPQAA